MSEIQHNLLFVHLFYFFNVFSWIPAQSSHPNPFTSSFYNTSSFKFHAPFAPLQLDKTRESDSVDCKPQNKMSRRMSFAMLACCSWPLICTPAGWLPHRWKTRSTSRTSPLGDPRNSAILNSPMRLEPSAALKSKSGLCF